MHTIRLRHPWQSQHVGDTTVWSRVFNWPAEPTPGEIVRLVVEPIDQGTTVSLNDAPLVSEPNGQFNITTLIAKSNRLAISTPAAPSDDSEKCPFEVRLEIVDG